MNADANPATGKTVGRRNFLAASLTTSLGLALMAKPVQASRGNSRSLSLYNPHRMEFLTVQYSVGGWYDPDAMGQINHFMRDPRTDEAIEIDGQLVDILYQIQQHAAAGEPLNVVSGYRSPRTNASMRAERRGRGVARNSYHMYGRAADIKLPGYRLARLRDIAVSLDAGGVGYYPYSDFIHVDTGPVRYW